MMSWLRQSARFSALVLIFLHLAACGVKGDPLPPEKPVELGRGRPTYKRATEGISIERRSIHDEEDKEEKADEEEN